MPFDKGGTDGGISGAAKTEAGAVQVACDGSNINSVALKLLQLKNPDGTYFVPSGPASITSATGATVGQATTFSVPAKFTENQVLGTADYVINSKNTLSTHFYYSKDPTTTSFSCGASGGAPGICYPDTALTGTIGTMYGVEKLTTIVTNHVVNEARFSVQRNAFVGLLNNAFTNSQVGISDIIPQNDFLDGITVTGLFSIGTFGNLPQSKWQTDWEAADDISWTHGKHTLRFGVEVERDRYNWNFAALADGALTFQTMQDFLLGLPGCSSAQIAAGCSAATPAAGHERNAEQQYLQFGEHSCGHAAGRRDTSIPPAIRGCLCAGRHQDQAAISLSILACAGNTTRCFTTTRDL